MRAIEHLCAAPIGDIVMGSLEDWWARHRELAQTFEVAAELALVGGFTADRLGYAFASGYQAAGRALFPSVVGPTALAATESGGVHPRAIATELSPRFELTGEKAFVTLGSFAERLLVVAKRGERDGRPDLCVVAIDRRSGMSLVNLATTPFAPEVPHARLVLDRVAVAPHEILPGDGYADYLKPFRTVEDIHVMAALAGHLVRIGRRASWPEDIIERTLSLGVTLCALADGDPSSPAIHLALAGALAEQSSLIEDIEPLWERVDAETCDRWQRDRPLLGVASSARTKRREAAWRHLGR